MKGEWSVHYTKKNTGRILSSFSGSLFTVTIQTLLQSSKGRREVHFRICKPVCKQRLGSTPELKEANQMLS